MKYTAIAILLACACKSEPPSDPTGDGFRKAEEAKLAAALIAPARQGPGFAIKPVPVPSTEATPGPAYLFVDDVGLVTINAGTAELTRLPLKTVSAMAIDREGSVILAGVTGVHRFKAGTAEKLGGTDAPAMGGTDLAVSPDGTIWLAAISTLHSWDGKAWTRHDKLGGKDPAIVRLMFDGQGRLYVIATETVFVRDADTWKIVYDVSTVEEHEPYIKRPALRDAYITKAGELVVVDAWGTTRLDGKAITRTQRTGDPLDRGRVVGDAFVTLSTRDMKIVRAPLAGGADKTTPLPGLTGSTSAIDARGRLWLAAKTGFTIVGADGGITTWPIGSMPAITSTVSAIAVAGTGPEQLPVPGAIAKGSIRGTVTRDGKPVARAYIEICKSPRSKIPKDKTPCTGEPIFEKGETDAAGVFTVSNLPLQDYKIVIRENLTWFTLLGRTCAGMAEGGTCDVGKLELTNTL